MFRMVILMLVSSFLLACGGSEGITITTTVSLPSVSSSSLSVMGTKDLTSEAVRAGLVVKVYDGDTFLGQSVTDRDGNAIILGANLTDGDHTLYFIIEDADGNDIAGAIENATITTAPLAKTVDSTEDLTYRSFLASCEERLGSPCAPGTNISEGSALVIPACVRETIAAMVQDIEDTSVGGHFGALLEAQRQNIASGGTISLKDVLKGDPSALTAFGSAFGSIASVAVSTAASTAASVLDHVVETMCADASVSTQADPALLGHLLLVVAPADVGSIDDGTLRSVFVNSLDIGDGPESFRSSRPAALAMMETMLQGGFTDITDTTEIRKRIAVVRGAGVPADATEAQRMAIAANNIFGSTHFASASLEHALSDFGPLLGDDDQMMNFINGGSQALDNIIDRFGSLDAFHTNFSSAGGAATFLADHPQGGVGATCTAIYDCLPPLNCQAGLCAGVTGLGEPCTSNSDCETTSNLACHPKMLTCVYALGQARNVNFGDGFTEATAGEERGRCLEGGTCSSNLVCLQRMCVSPGTSSELCSDGRCIGAEDTTNCAADCGSVDAENYCGDGTCNGSEVRRTCPRDCPMPPAFQFTASTFTDDCRRTSPTTFSAGSAAVDLTFTTSSQGSTTWNGTTGSNNPSASIAGGIWSTTVNQSDQTAGGCVFSRQMTFTVSTDTSLSTCTWSLKRTKVSGTCGQVIGPSGTNFCTQTATNASCTIP